MRAASRSVVVAILALLGVVLLAIPSTTTSAVTLGAFALIVPGNPDVTDLYDQNAVNYYIVPTTPSCAVTCTPVGITYNRQSGPIPSAVASALAGLGLQNINIDWNATTANGVASVGTAYNQILASNPGSDIVIWGYSEGTTVGSIEKSMLAGANGGTVPNNVSFVEIGNLQRPNGGILERLAALGTVPVFDATVGNPTPTNTAAPGQINTTDITFQYDGVADFPQYPLDLLADLNAIAGYEYVHGTYLSPDPSHPAPAMPYGYTVSQLEAAMADPANRQTHGDTLYITIPVKTLPIVPFLDPAAATGTTGFVTPIVDLISPTLRVLIELGYDRTDYGQPTPFQLFPPVNPAKLVTLPTDLVAAAVQGVQAALGDVGGPSVLPGTLTPSNPPTLTASPVDPAPVTTPVTTSAAPTMASTATTANINGARNNQLPNVLGSLIPSAPPTTPSTVPAGAALTPGPRISNPIGQDPTRIAGTLTSGLTMQPTVTGNNTNGGSGGHAGTPPGGHTK
jgi:hypothetical protein